MQPTTRRNVIRSAAWVAPAVVVVSAAPAFAASTTGTLTIDPGNTRYGIAPIDGIDAGARTILFNGFTITPSAAGSGPLTLVVTQGSGAAPFDEYDPPSGWNRASPTGATAITFQYAAPSFAAGGTIPFGPSGTDGIYFDDNIVRGTFSLTVQAPGFDSESFGFAPLV